MIYSLAEMWSQLKPKESCIMCQNRQINVFFSKAWLLASQVWLQKMTVGRTVCTITHEQAQTVKCYLAHWGCVDVFCVHACACMSVFCWRALQLLIFVSHFCSACWDQLYKLSSLWFCLKLMRQWHYCYRAELCVWPGWDCIQNTKVRNINVTNFSLQTENTGCCKISLLSTLLLCLIEHLGETPRIY